MFNALAALMTSDRSQMKMKGFKIRSHSGNYFGIVAQNLSDAVNKGKQKLKIPKNESVKVVLEDGTEVDSDEYFRILEPQTPLVFLRSGETLSSDLLKAFRNFNHQRAALGTDQVKDLLNSLRETLSLEDLDLLEQFIEVSNTNISLESIQDDKQWFEGLDKKYKTKSSYMRYLAQKRIRNYYNTAKDQIKEEKDPIVKCELDIIFKQIHHELKKNKEHGYYFDRNSSEDKLCDNEGWFICEGPFDEDICEKLHRINPYASKSKRIMFGQWNLDHIIEKKRQVIPQLIEAARMREETRQLDYKKVYTLLFTKNNLRLVQYDCHKKEARAQIVNVEEFYS